MMKTKTAVRALLALGTLGVLGPLGIVADDDKLRGSLSPDESIALHTRSSPSGSGVSLVRESDGAEFCELPLSDGAAQWIVDHGIEQILWSPDGGAVAIVVSDPTASDVYACTRDVDGTWRANDLSAVEIRNRAKLGLYPREHYRRVQNSLVKWTDSTAMFNGKTIPGRLIEIQTRFWDHTGQRYTVRDSVAIRLSGEVRWR